MILSVSHDEIYSPGPGVSELSMAQSIDRWAVLSTSTNPAQSISSHSQSSIYLVQMTTLHDSLVSAYSTLNPFLDGYVDDLSDLHQIHSRSGLGTISAAAVDEILYPESLGTLRDSLLWELDATEWMFHRSMQNKL